MTYPLYLESLSHLRQVFRPSMGIIEIDTIGDPWWEYLYREKSEVFYCRVFHPDEADLQGKPFEIGLVRGEPEDAYYYEDWTPDDPRYEWLMGVFGDYIMEAVL